MFDVEKVGRCTMASAQHGDTCNVHVSILLGAPSVNKACNKACSDSSQNHPTCRFLYFVHVQSVVLL